MVSSGTLVSDTFVHGVLHCCMGQLPLVVQDCWSGPGHWLPPFAGAGLLQLLDCVPAVALSVVEAVHVQPLQSDQPPSTRQPLAVQGPEPSDQAPAVSLSRVFAVHSQVRQICVLQDRLCVWVGEQVPPHAAGSIMVLVLRLLCVPPPQGTLQALQALQAPQRPKTQSVAGRVPVAL